MAYNDYQRKAVPRTPVYTPPTSAYTQSPRYNNNTMVQSSGASSQPGYQSLRDIQNAAFEVADTVDPYTGQRLGYGNAAFNLNNDNLSSADIMQLLTDPGPGPGPSGPSGSRRRSGGGGGGGGPVGPTPEVQAAMLQYLSDLQGNTTISDAYDTYESGINAAYDPSKIDARYDRAGADVGAAGTLGRDRVAGIIAQLQGRGAQGRRDVADVFSRGQTALEGLGNRFSGAQTQQAADLGGVLSRFGSGGNSTAGADASLRNLFAAGQATNATAGNAFDAALADRPALYAALGADVNTGMTRQEAGLMSQIAAQRAGALTQNQQQLAGILGQSGINRAEAQLSREQQINDFKLQMAQLGITIPDGVAPPAAEAAGVPPPVIPPPVSGTQQAVRLG